MSWIFKFCQVLIGLVFPSDNEWSFFRERYDGSFSPSSLARHVESFSNYFPGEKFTYNALKNTRKLSTMRRFRDRKLRLNSLSSIHSSIPFFPTRLHNFTVASQKHSCSTCIAKYNNITQRGELAEEMLISYSYCHLSTWSESLESFLADPTLRYNS